MVVIVVAAVASIVVMSVFYVPHTHPPWEIEGSQKMAVVKSTASEGACARRCVLARSL